MEYKGIVLLVEDNAELNANNARALRMLDYDVHPALTLAEARTWLGNKEPDVILLDVMLPDGDGINFCAEIRGAPLAHSSTHFVPDRQNRSCRPHARPCRRWRRLHY